MSHALVVYGRGVPHALVVYGRGMSRALVVYGCGMSRALMYGRGMLCTRPGCVWA